MANYKNATHNTSVIWDEMQINVITQLVAIVLFQRFMLQFHCCGVEGPRDWRNSSIVNNTEGFIPMSCCGHEAGALGNFSCTLNSRTLYQEGCVKKFGEFVEDNASTIGLAGLGLAFIQVQTCEIRIGHENNHRLFYSFWGFSSHATCLDKSRRTTRLFKVQTF